MKKLYYLLFLFLGSTQFIQAQHADPALGGAYFSLTENSTGASVTLTFNYANSGSTVIPTGAVEISISSAATFYNSDGLTAPSETGGPTFSWRFVGGDTWKGINTSPITAFGGGEVQLSYDGIQASSDYEITSINIQPISDFELFANSPMNDNLQLGLRINDAGPIALQAKILLQGSVAFGDDIMYDSLRSQGLIPLTEPYTAAANFNHAGEGGGETIADSILETTGNQAIVDWVFVELRDAMDSTQVITTRSALVQRDGDIVDTDGVSMLTFNSAAAANYYVAIRHRNHLGVMTTNHYPLSVTPTIVDFTMLNDTYTWGLHAQKDLKGDGSLWGLWSGNSNGDNFEIFQGIDNDPGVIFFDVLSAPNNTDFLANYINNQVYSNSDVNMDGQVIFQGPQNEPNYIFFNVLSYPANTSFIKNYILTERLP